ncbi:DUF1709-domain-containing protein [Ceratocystis lukuohia]|uniref:DUF1709-domain-containing protein n=1 Tax=Ceratocystis lukuohia TaxID=2019550 RepID=A0ABR4MIG9_9PEZI
MASSEPVHPLRINKTPSPTKKLSAPRPLSEISPGEKRRNSPSWNQATKTMVLNPDSSPFQPSPADSTASPRIFWQSRNSITENSLLYGSTNMSPSAMRRSSLERLQKASRVKNSNILALEQKQEYDPTRIHYIERPLAKVQGNAFGGTGIRANFEHTEHLRTPERKNDFHQRTRTSVATPATPGHVRGAASMSSLTSSAKSYNGNNNKPLQLGDPILSSPPADASTPETRSPLPAIPPHTPNRGQVSPIKSSLSASRFKSSFNEETGQWTLEDTGHPHRTLHRHAKSVTFDNAPPQVNEYEMATPDLSSIDTESNEGSYVDDDDEEDDEYDDQMYRHDDPEDSFDASLEDTDKTPVVLPDDEQWQTRSPPTPKGDENNHYQNSPGPSSSFAAAAAAGRQLQQRTETLSSSDHRPLPPLPGRELKLSSIASSPAADSNDRLSTMHRGLPSPPAHRGNESHMSNIGHSKMPLEERLKLMMLSDDGKSAAEQQRERRLRRAGGRDKVSTPESDALHSVPQSPSFVDVKATVAASSALSASTGSVDSANAKRESLSTPQTVESLVPPPPIGRLSLGSPRSSTGTVRLSLDTANKNNRDTTRESLTPTPMTTHNTQEEESSVPASPPSPQSVTPVTPATPGPTQTQPESQSPTNPQNQNDYGYDEVSEYESGSDENVEISVLSDYDLPPLTRESIMRGVDKTKVRKRESDYNFSSPPPSSSPLRPTTAHSNSAFAPTPEIPVATEESSMMYDDEEDGGSVIIRRDLAEMVTDDEETENSVIIHRNGVYDMYTDDSYAETDGDFTGAECDTTSQFSSHVDSEKSVVTRDASASGLASPPTQTEIDITHPPKLALNAPLLPRPDRQYSTQRLKLAAPEIDIPMQASSGQSTPRLRPRTPPRTLSKPEYDGTGWGEPSEYETSEYTNEDDEPSSPESVIRHPIDDGSVFESEDDLTEQEGHCSDHDQDEDITPEPETHTVEAPAIPERQATIKASGSTLKTRPSATPADMAAMREQRRIVSREIPMPDVPPISDSARERLSVILNVEQDLAGTEGNGSGDYIERHPSFKKRSLTLDLDTGLSLDKDFDRVIEAQKVAFEHNIQQLTEQNMQECGVSSEKTTRRPSRLVSAGRSGKPRLRSRKPSSEAQDSQQRQPSSEKTDISARTLYGVNIPHAATYANIASRPKRGYLMRQNTKLVSASDKDNEPDSWKARSAGNSPVKTEQRPPAWVVEPWNSKRQRSLRSRAMANAAPGAVPPMPGQESNAQQVALNPLVEEEPDLATDEAGERGRLFVKVMGVKDLDLPIPKNERTWFSLTLDNGVHCVTTAWLELARKAPIGQEFELVVPNDLEFQLTLNVKLDKPVHRAAPAAAPVRMTKAKTSTFSRVFASPKKRKEMEMRLREEEDRAVREQQEAQAKQQRSAAPTAWDLLSPLAAEDGSFARSYVCLKDHEAHCFGRPYLAEVACFNEWAKEEATFASSVKSKRGNNGVVRRAPYKIGKLDLQLLFVPRPKGSSDEDMPKSMNSCIREMKAAEERLATCFEGHLSQQGGDCPYWRRRYFKLVGTRLTAYHEANRQPRATINLANARRLIDDRRALTEREITGKGGRRRRSAFAEDEEGYMFVEEGFRIRFNNGEVIDFYADTAQEKEAWMRVLVEVIGRPEGGIDDGGSAPKRSKWCDVVFKREETLRRRAAEARQMHARNKNAM